MTCAWWVRFKNKQPPPTFFSYPCHAFRVQLRHDVVDAAGRVEGIVAAVEDQRLGRGRGAGRQQRGNVERPVD